MYIPVHDMLESSLQSRSLYSIPPNAQTKVGRNPALLVSWWCTVFALAIIMVRLAGRYIRTEKLFREDKIMAWSIVPLLIRMGLVHCILLWGTNNANLAGMTEIELYHRQLGSKLVLPARIAYTAFLWTAKFTISEFLKRLFYQYWSPTAQRSLCVVRWFLGLTFIAVVISTLTECTPFDHYWQVVPDPGPQCRQAYVQLLTLGTSDMITDLVLVCFPIPILFQSSLRTKRKVSLTLLFGLSLFLVATTLYRIIITFDRHGNQQFRSLLASVEILAAAGVSNAIVLGSFVRDRGVKKQRFKFGSTSGSSTLDRPSLARTRANTLFKNHNTDSEVDLFNGLGMRFGPEFDREKSSIARPAPAVLPLDLNQSPDEITPAPPSWTFPGREPVESDEVDFEMLKMEEEDQPSPPSMLDGLVSRQMSFFDVGGLLEDHPSRTSSASTSTPLNPSYSSRMPRQSSFSLELTPLSSRQGSNVFLRDLGGLLEENQLTESMSVPPTVPSDA